MPGPVMGPHPTLAREPTWVFPCKEGLRSPPRMWAVGMNRPGLLLHNLCFLASGLRCRLWGWKMGGFWYSVWVMHPCWISGPVVPESLGVSVLIIKQTPVSTS